MAKKSNLDVAKEIIDKFFDIADCGLFNTRNLVGDPMTTVYDANGLVVDICYYYSYFEVFGLSPDEFKELSKYYNQKQKENDNNG